MPATKTVFCGRASSDANALWNPICGALHACTTTDPKTGKTSAIDAFATLTLIDGSWTDPVVWCPSTATPARLLAGIRQQAERLLPRVGIGIAPPGGVTLVNIQTILWAATSADRSLASVTVVGRRVALRVHLTGANWTFGDGTTDRATGPGTPYDEARNPCRTKQCPGYYGHTYRRTGHLTIALRLAWHAQYNPGGGWLDIPGDLNGPTATKTVTVKQARAILVPNP